ncbi:hypothetical protein BS17DRAFT_339001 [Gyrodon lividus]|nr:hypothetical protein BS17DRAFT_339001 [Gyrodon lividus]
MHAKYRAQLCSFLSHDTKTASLRTYPMNVLIPHKIMATGAQAQKEPANGGFMRVVTRSQPGQGFDESVEILDQPRKKVTQQEQDAADDKARKQAMDNLVSSWQERLQLISVITTFFASTEAAMLVNTKPLSQEDLANSTLNASNASLLGALIMHAYAAVLSFLAAFMLVRYKLQEATREELEVEGIKLVNSPLGGSVRVKDIERDLNGLEGPRTVSIDAQPTSPNSERARTMKLTAELQMRRDSYPVEPPIISTNPHIEWVGPFVSKTSSHLLNRIHALCVALASIGFVLAIVGILCYAWALHPPAVSIFTSACLGGAILAMVTLFI